MSKKFIYILSEVSVSDRHTDLYQTSFEKVTEEEYNEFKAIKEPYLHFNPGKHHYVDVTLGDEWSIEVISDEEMINAIEKLWKYLPNHGHIDEAIEKYRETS